MGTIDPTCGVCVLVSLPTFPQKFRTLHVAQDLLFTSAMSRIALTLLAGLCLLSCASDDPVGDLSDESGVEEDGSADTTGRQVARGYLVCPKPQDWTMQCPNRGIVTLYTNRFWTRYEAIDTETHILIKGSCEQINDQSDPMYDNRVDTENYACAATAYVRERDTGPFYILGRIEAPGMEPGFPYVDISEEIGTFTTKKSASGRSAMIYSGPPTRKKTIGPVREGMTFKYDNSIVWGPWNRTADDGTPYKTYFFRLEETSAQ